MAHSNKMVVGENLNLSSQTKTLFAVLIFVGLGAFVFTLLNNPERAWHAYLIGLFYFTSLSLGGLFFSAIQHITKAGWSVTIRRLAESLTAFLPYAALAAIGLLFGGKALYSWLRPEVIAVDSLVQHKGAYLNLTFWLVRLVVFFGSWILFAKVIVGRSVAQDKTGDVSLTHSLLGPSILFVAVFALSYSLFSVDLLMSLDPHWFSTIFGVYCFAGLFQSTMATLILLVIFLRGKGLLQGLVNENHLHDLGKFLFAFTVFWAYIAFSQYMLIWYANLPEETIFYLPRSQGSWMWMSLMLIVFKFVVPFIALLPRWAKRSSVHLTAVSILILVMQFFDLYWLVYPNLNSEKVVFALPEVLIFCGFLGGFLFVVTRFLGINSVIPAKDPRLQEAIGHHVVY